MHNNDDDLLADDIPDMTNFMQIKESDKSEINNKKSQSKIYFTSELTINL